MSQKPFVGAVVQYKDRFTGSSEPQAAIIVKVHDEKWVALFIISPGGGTRYASHVEQGEGWEFIVQTPEPQSYASGWAGGIRG